MNNLTGFLSSKLSFVLSFSMKKKIMAFFIFGCMAVNGFVPSTIEVSKYSFVMIFAAVTQNAVTQVFSKCNDSVVAMSNKVCSHLYSFLFDDKNNLAGNPLKKEGHKTSDNAADKSTPVIEQITINKNRSLTADITDKSVSVYVSAVKLFMVYERYKIPDNRGAIILIAIVFIFAIRQRKEFEEIINNILAEKKTRISA
jgi:hypothetical protein